METKIEKFEREVKAMKMSMINMAVKDGIDLSNIDSDEVVAIVNILKLFDTSVELISEEYRTINTINEKIDKLIAKVGA